MANQYGGSYDQREQIRDAIDIVDLVERYVPLRRQGAIFVGRCPWHDDSRPSLQVNATRQTFKCWVCNIGGDVFSFIMKIENVDFKEGLQILADMAGIELIKRPPKKPWKPKYERPAVQGPDADAPSLDAPKRSDPGAPTTDVYADFDEEYVPSEAELNELRGGPPAASQGSSAPAPQGPIWRPKEITKADLYRSMEWMASKYREAFLNDPEAEEARKYVRDRGISEESSLRYLIGYAPLAYDSTLNWIRFDRNRVRILEEAGILAYREDYDDRGKPRPRPNYAPTPRLTPDERRRYYDRFRGRLMFPIRDVQNRVVAFGGRLLPNTTLKSPAKYVNSPETPIFTKSKTLYGLDAARHAINATKKVLVTEGYTDCIVTSQFGFGNVVAVLGTALGPEHVRILKRFADKMILLLDGDGPGQKRTREVLRFFVEQGVDMSVLTLPDDNDPCEFLLEKGPEAFAELLENGTVDALDFAFNAAASGIDLDSDVIGSAKALDSLLDVVALYDGSRSSADDPARLRIVKTIQRFAVRFRVSEQEIRRQLIEKRAKSQYYSRRAEEREERYEQRRLSENAAENAAPVDSEEERIKAFRRNWIYPIASVDDESDEELRARFFPFERDVWNDRRLLPDAFEREYLEVLLASPKLYPRLAAQIPNDYLRSPVARQLDLLARECLEHEAAPTYDRLVLRYDDDSMKSFLIELDDAVSAKDYARRLATVESQDAILRDLFAAAERIRHARELPRQMSVLLEAETSPQDKTSALLALRQALNARQNNRADSFFDDDSRSVDPIENGSPVKTGYDSDWETREGDDQEDDPEPRDGEDENQPSKTAAAPNERGVFTSGSRTSQAGDWTQWEDDPDDDEDDDEDEFWNGEGL